MNRAEKGMKKGMIKKYKKPIANVSNGVEFILRGSQRRRSMAISNARSVNSDLGLMTKRLVAVK